jgi:hypothetical protein
MRAHFTERSMAAEGMKSAMAFGLAGAQDAERVAHTETGFFRPYYP